MDKTQLVCDKCGEIYLAASGQPAATIDIGFDPALHAMLHDCGGTWRWQPREGGDSQCGFGCDPCIGELACNESKPSSDPDDEAMAMLHDASGGAYGQAVEGPAHTRAYWH